MSVEMAGQPIAWASVAARPNASGSIEATTVTCAARYAAAISSTCPARRTRSATPSRLGLPPQCRDKAIAPLGIAGQHHHGVAEPVLRLQQAAASISTFWPFQEVSRAACRMTGCRRDAATAGARLSPDLADARRARNCSMSTPRWMMRMRACGVP